MHFFHFKCTPIFCRITQHKIWSHKWDFSVKLARWFDRYYTVELGWHFPEDFSVSFSSWAVGLTWLILTTPAQIAPNYHDYWTKLKRCNHSKVKSDKILFCLQMREDSYRWAHNCVKWGLVFKIQPPLTLHENSLKKQTISVIEQYWGQGIFCVCKQVSFFSNWSHLWFVMVNIYNSFHCKI